MRHKKLIMMCVWEGEGEWSLFACLWSDESVCGVCTCFCVRGGRWMRFIYIGTVYLLHLVVHLLLVFTASWILRRKVNVGIRNLLYWYQIHATGNVTADSTAYCLIVPTLCISYCTTSLICSILAFCGADISIWWTCIIINIVQSLFSHTYIIVCGDGHLYFIRKQICKRKTYSSKINTFKQI